MSPAEQHVSKLDDFRLHRSVLARRSACRAEERRAHDVFDRAVDRLDRRSGFVSERERVEHLFMLYEKMRAPLERAARGKPKRHRGNPASRRRIK